MYLRSFWYRVGLLTGNDALCSGGNASLPTQHPAPHEGVTAAESGKPLQGVHTDHVMHEVGLAVDATSGLDAKLQRCAAYLENAQEEPIDELRLCLVRCALAARLQGLAPDHAWTSEQCACHAELLVKVEVVDALHFGLVRQVPVSDVEAVLQTALQQAASSPHGLEALRHLSDLCGQLQGWAEPRGYFCAQVLWDGLHQALDQLSAAGTTPEQAFRLSLLEEDLRHGPVGRFCSALRERDLWTAADGVRSLKALPNSDALVMQWACDVVGALKDELARQGLSMDWTTIGSRTPGEDRAIDPGRRFAVALRAWGVLRCMGSGIEAIRPFEPMLLNWLRAQLLTDEVQPAVRGLLEEAPGGSRVHSLLMELFARTMCSPQTAEEDLMRLVLNYAEHVELADALTPIWAPSAPNEALMSGFDRLCAIALRLSECVDHPSLSEAPTASWRAGWTVLLDMSRAMLAEKDALLTTPPALWMQAYLSSQRKSSAAPRQRNLVERLWTGTAANGLRSPVDGYVLTRPGQHQSTASGLELMPFWTPEAWQAMVDGLAPFLSSGLTEDEKAASVRRNLMGILLLHEGDLVRFAANMARNGRFTKDADWITASVEACQQWADEVLRKGETSASRAYFLADIWAGFAAERPDWLASVKGPYPWVEKAVEAIKAIGETRDAINWTAAYSRIWRLLREHCLKKQ